MQRAVQAAVPAVVLLGLALRAGAAEPAPRCDCGMKLPAVTTLAQARAVMGKRVVVYGVLGRVPMRKGKGKWRGTGVVLDDGTVVYITYGDPPAGWDARLDMRVCVRGRLLNWSSLTKQSIVGPHLSELDFPVPVGPDDRPLADDALPSQVGRHVTLTGTARDAKGGAVLLAGSGEPVYIDDLDAWPEALHGKQVTATGHLRRRQHLPQAKVDEHSAVSQGAQGKQYVLEGARWQAR